MSVESDTMHYYADIAHDEAFDAACERAFEDVQGRAYDWIAKRFGENLAIALIDEMGYTDAEVLSSVREARANFQSWAEGVAVKSARETMRGG